MIHLFEVSVNIFETFIIIMFLTLYFGCRYKGFLRYAGFAAGLFGTVATITVLNYTYIYEGLFGLFLIIVYFLYALIFLKGDVYTKIFISGFIDCIVQTIALITILMISKISGKNYSELLIFSGERLWLIAITKILLIIVCVLLLKFRFYNILRGKNVFMLVLLPIVAELSVTEIVNVFLIYDRLQHEIFIISMSIVAIIVLSYYLCIRLNYDAQIEEDYKILKQKYELDSLHTQDLEELYSRIFGIRHDLLNHFTIISTLIEKDSEKAKKYIDSLTDNQIERLGSFIQTDNECLNAVVNTKIAVCEKFGINTEVRIMNKSVKKLTDDEIGVIFGNLFDNAIEAAKNSKSKNIELDVKLNNEDTYIVMLNSVKEAVLAKNKELGTTKQNKDIHGFGTKNIKRIVNKYEGIINYFEENDKFGCQIII